MRLFILISALLALALGQLDGSMESMGNPMGIQGTPDGSMGNLDGNTEGIMGPGTTEAENFVPNMGGGMSSSMFKQINDNDGISRQFNEGRMDDDSTGQLLKSFQSDDTNGNYLHHGSHGDYRSMNEETGTQRQYASYNNNNYLVTKGVHFIIYYGQQSMGRVLIGLFGNTVPKTAANFAALADHTVSIFNWMKIMSS